MTREQRHARLLEAVQATGRVKVSDLAVILPPDLPAQFLRTEVIADRQSRIAVPYPLPNVWCPPTSPMQFL